MVADRLAPRELLGDLPATTEVVDVAKLPRGRSARQEEINRLIVERALAGQRVARFKGGDSFVFGRGFEEIEACREAGVAVHVIPGLSSPLAVPAVAGIPVTHRAVAHEFTVVSGHLPPGRPGVAGRLGGARPAARHPAADDGRRERARTSRPRCSPPAAPGTPRSRSSATGRCRASAPCSPRSADLGADLRPARRTAAGDHRGRRRRRGRPPRAFAGRAPASDGRAESSWHGELIEVTDPDDPRLADYRDLRDVQLRTHLEAEHGLFLAEGEKVVRRAVEAGFTARSFLMAPRWLDGLADVLGPTDAPCYVLSEDLAEQVTGFHVHRGALASLRRRPAADPRRGPRRRSPGAGARGPRRPHQRRGDLPLRRGVRLRRRAARPALRRPALPPLDQGRHGRRLQHAVDPPPRLVRRASRTSALAASRRSRSPWPTTRPPSRTPSPGSTGWRSCSARRDTVSRRAGSSSADRRAVIAMRAGHRLAQRRSRDRGRLLRHRSSVSHRCRRPVGGVAVGGLVVRLLELLAPAGREPVAEDGAVGVVGLVLEGAREQPVAAEDDTARRRGRSPRPSRSPGGPVARRHPGARGSPRRPRRACARGPRAASRPGCTRHPRCARRTTSWQSKTKRARSTPIWQAASPTPSAAYIVATMSAARARSVVVVRRDRAVGAVHDVAAPAHDRAHPATVGERAVRRVVGSGGLERHATDGRDRRRRIV